MSFVCTFCRHGGKLQRVFKTQTNLNTHIAFKHKNKEPKICKLEECNNEIRTNALYCNSTHSRVGLRRAKMKLSLLRSN